MSLMTIVHTSEDFMSFLQKLERSTWQHTYKFFIRRIIQSDFNYQLIWCFPDIQDTSYGDCFLDFTGPDGFTTLPTGALCWLINIRLGYLIFHQGDTCTIKPYLPSQFARQFGCDQLYVGNPNTGLHFSRNLLKGYARGIFTWPEGWGHRLVFLNDHPILISASAFTPGISSSIWCRVTG